MLDIVLPAGNESELIEMAHRMGYTELLLLYNKPTPAPKSALLKTFSGVLLSKPTQHFDGMLTAAAGADNARSFLEHNPPVIIYNLELAQLPDTMTERSSGLNQVLCALAAGKTRICFSFANILAFSGMKRARLLGRIMQNILLCRKYNVHMGIASFASASYQLRSPYDLKSYFQQLGMKHDELKNAFKVPSVLC